MHSKNHRQNHDFQIAHFLVGACHTPDGAYAMLCDLKEEREQAIANYHVNQLRTEAKEIRAKKLMESDDEADRKEGAADLLEIENGRAFGKVLYDAAVAELKFIEDCIARIQPFRKYAHLPDLEAHEAMQAEEWKLELMHRAENFLLTIGHIPTDQFATMRMHPAFASEIWPSIQEMGKLLSGGPEGVKRLQARVKPVLGPFSEPASFSPRP
jgi:hypothetical protein